jgi:hypothetical protein
VDCFHSDDDLLCIGDYPRTTVVKPRAAWRGHLERARFIVRNPFRDIAGSCGPTVVQASESKRVWMNTASGVYHYPDTRWYGETKQGEFMSEADAKAKGYRPARNGQ